MFSGLMQASAIISDVHPMYTLPVLVASRHSREACPVLDTGAGIQETRAMGTGCLLVQA